MKRYTLKNKLHIYSCVCVCVCVYIYIYIYIFQSNLVTPPPKKRSQNAFLYLDYLHCIVQDWRVGPKSKGTQLFAK
jgi:hypothetical protein